MNAIKTLTWRNISHLRSFSRCAIYRQSVAAGLVSPSEPLTIPPPDGADKIYSPKLEKIASDITQLNLLEVSELSQLLKTRLNLPDQPMMPMGGFAVAAQAPAADDDVAAAPAAVQTQFTVKMTKFDDKQKVAIIKEIKSVMEGYNLVQAKKFVESLPAVVKADITKEEAEKLKEALTKVGAEIVIE